ncbi:hypothetical protein DFH06DRAFT_754018 [Mycena polygramma]|nr:hypothetical protein DFH06DRAFT_754018 [Mycena polygramma]
MAQVSNFVHAATVCAFFLYVVNHLPGDGLGVGMLSDSLRVENRAPPSSNSKYSSRSGTTGLVTLKPSYNRRVAPGILSNHHAVAAVGHRMPSSGKPSNVFRSCIEVEPVTRLEASSFVTTGLFLVLLSHAGHCLGCCTRSRSPLYLRLFLAIVFARLV